MALNILKKILLCFCCIALVTHAKAQDNVFFFDKAPSFSQSALYTYIYAIPVDSVRRILYERGEIDPGVAWMQRPAYIVPSGKVDSLLNKGALAFGNYLLVTAVHNQMLFRIFQRQGFTVDITDIDRIKILNARDAGGQELRDVTVVLGNKTLSYDTGMRGFVISEFAGGDVLSVRRGAGIWFYNCSLQENTAYVNPRWENEATESAKRARTFNGYLVTNKPVYLPHDTVKWKAYLENPFEDNRLVREPLSIRFSEHSYNSPKQFHISAAHKAEKPGVYFGEFVLGDSVQMDRVYNLHLYGARSELHLHTPFKTADYLLDDTHLRVTGDGYGTYQPGDSVNLFAYAYNSNNLPVLDGQITITVRPQTSFRNAKDPDIIPDTLYHTTVPVNPAGETNIGFPTRGFSPQMRGFIYHVSLTNANNEHSDTSFYISFSNEERYIRVKQTGRTVHAELIRNKRSVNGKGSLEVRAIRTGSVDKPITFPYDHILDENEYSLVFRLLDDTGGVVSLLSHSVQDAQITSIEDFKGDTAVLELSNPNHVLYRYSVFVGDEFRGYGHVRGDTVIKVLSKEGKTVSFVGSYSWIGNTRRQDFAVFRLDRELDIELRKKDLVFPGQRDTISVRLSNKDGKAVSGTNVTVLAFNSRFVEDYTANLPYGGLVYPAYVSKQRRTIEPLYPGTPGQIIATKQWLSRCGADTMFFYKNLYLLPDDVAWVTYDIPESVMPQVGIYLQRAGFYYQPQVIYVDGRPVYLRQARATDPAGFFVAEGRHALKFRTPDAEYNIPDFEVCGGMKTDLYLKLDSIGWFFRTDTVGDTIKTYRVERHMRTLLSKVTMPEWLQASEKNLLANYLLLYRPEGARYYAGGSYRELDMPQFFQWPLHVIAWRGIGYINYGHPHYETASPVQLIGPINPHEYIGFFQQGNAKLLFEWQRDYLFMFRPQMTRVEKVSTESYLNERLTDAPFWPRASFVTLNPPAYDSQLLVPVHLAVVNSGNANSVQVMDNKNADRTASYGSGIKGTLKDERGNPIVNANVEVSQGGILAGRDLTDFDGNYSIRPLNGGRYTVRFTYLGRDRIITDVAVAMDQTVRVNGVLSTSTELKGATVTTSRYVVPIIDPEAPGGRMIKTAEPIERSPSRNASDIASLSTQVYQGGSGNGLSIGGGRSSGTKYVIDGVQLNSGSSNFIKDANAEADAAANKAPLKGMMLDRNTDASKAFFSNFMANMTGASGMRQSFRDWAIWEPNLWTGRDGVATFNVTYPDNLTSWKTYVLAMNRDGYAGRILRITRAFKPLSGELLVPRFLRYGDTAEGIGKVANYMQEPFRLRSSFLLDGKGISSDSMTVHNTQVQRLQVAAPAGNVLDTAQLSVSYSFTADNGYMDGESRLLPVLPVGVIESHGDTYFMSTDTTIASAPDPALGHFAGRARLQVDGSMLEVMLREVENLKEFPHGCNEQMTTKLLAIYYEEAIKKLLDRKDFNNTVTKKAILEKLVRAQNSDGGFGWWNNNGSGDYRITNYIISTMQKVNSDGWLSYIIRRGHNYLNNQLSRMSVADKLTSLRTLTEGNYPGNYKSLLDGLDTQKSNSIYDRLLLIKIRKQQGLPYRVALDSVMKERKESTNTIYWGVQNYDWYRDDLASTLMAYSIIKGDSVYGKFIPDITRYILFKRERGYYHSTAASGLVLTTILPDLLGQKPVGTGRTPTYIRISGSVNDSVYSFPKALDVRAHNPSFSITKKGLSPAFVSVVYDYFNANPVARDSDFVVRTHFLNAKSGDTMTVLKAGEKVTLRTTVICKKEGEYIMIEVPIPAGCMQVDKGPHYREAAREHFKDQTDIFCDKLSPGTYTFDIILEARFKGSYSLSPARAGLMYYPEAYGNTEVKRVHVR